MEKLNFTTPRVSVDEESYGIVSKPVYLRDEESVEKGWVLICVDNYPLGFGKAAGGSVKNKYLAGWRWM